MALVPSSFIKSNRRIDTLYWARLESEKGATFDVVRCTVNDPSELKEVEAVLLDLRGDSEFAKSREIVREASRAVVLLVVNPH